MPRMQLKWIDGIKDKSLSEQLEEMENLMVSTCSDNKLNYLHGKLNYASSCLILEERIDEHSGNKPGGRYARAKAWDIGQVHGQRENG